MQPSRRTNPNPKKRGGRARKEDNGDQLPQTMRRRKRQMKMKMETRRWMWMGIEMEKTNS